MSYTLASINPGSDISFTETFDFSEIGDGSDPDRVIDDRLAQLLAITACVSYYKLAAPPRIVVDFPVAPFEVEYLRQVIEGGLGEFAYVNDLPAALTPVIEVRSERAPAERVIDSWNGTAQPLVAVGGGKDSVVTIEALKSGGWTPVLFSVNRYQPIDDCIAVSGLGSIHVRRRIDAAMTDLNKAGAYNGHIPVTAINSCVALVAADLLGLGSVIMSNEQSADIENLVWHGFNVNHQWSKSIVYEDLLRATLAGYGFDSNRYFSLLRALPESEIANRFSECVEYFDVFVSCNRSFALDPSRRRSRWCGECPKCLFVFVILAPRIPKERLVGIFAANLLDTSANLDLYRELAGLEKHKPFECVGDYSEVAEAFVDLLDSADWASDSVVAALATERTSLETIAARRTSIIGSGNVPDEFAGVFNALLP
ncbi:hypothetical protein [Gordonia sp. (in: high G+C Gram-positive bacteria)]|uniref:hypothetical protein n=1 Tax=Gordonia sp. (in: high G+C Gram-positive bacteria) TaxID=84139 RepID=UPI003C78399D